MKRATRISAQSGDRKMPAPLKMLVMIMGMKVAKVFAAIKVMPERHLRPPAEVVIFPKIWSVVAVIIIRRTVIAVLAIAIAAPDAADEVAAGIAFFAFPIDVTP